MRLAVLLVFLWITMAEALAQGRVHVRGYTRRDGTYVRPHTRSAPGGGGGGIYSAPSYSSFSEYDLLSNPYWPQPGPIRLEPPAVKTEAVKRTNTEPVLIKEPPEDPIIAYQKRDAAKGFPEAQYALGMRYMTGAGVPKDPARGRELILLAAEKGCERAREKRRELAREDKAARAPK